MAVNESRSMNANLAAGLADGSIKRIAPDWGGDDADVHAVSKRNDQLQSQYGMVTYEERSAEEAIADRQLKLNERPIGKLAFPEPDRPLLS